MDQRGPWEDLRDADDMGEEQADQRMIRARLNVPLIKDPQPGIIYLTVLQKPRSSGFSLDVWARDCQPLGDIPSASC